MTRIIFNISKTIEEQIWPVYDYFMLPFGRIYIMFFWLRLFYFDLWNHYISLC